MISHLEFHVYNLTVFLLAQPEENEEIFCKLVKVRLLLNFCPSSQSSCRNAKNMGYLNHCSLEATFYQTDKLKLHESEYLVLTEMCFVGVGT